MNIEHRLAHRIPFDCFVDLKTDDSGMVCELYDISLQGALVGACSGATPIAGTSCQLTINLDESNETHDFVMDIRGTVARKVENKIGIKFNSMDLNSVTILRRLLEYNLGNGELIHRDFESLVREK